MSIYDDVKVPWTPEEAAAIDEYQSSGKLHPLTCPVCVAPLERLRYVALKCPAGHYHQYWYPGIVLAIYRFNDALSTEP